MPRFVVPTAREIFAFAQRLSGIESRDCARLLPEHEVHEEPSRHVDLKRECEHRDEKRQDRMNRDEEREQEKLQEAARPDPHAVTDDFAEAASPKEALLLTRQRRRLNAEEFWILRGRQPRIRPALTDFIRRNQPSFGFPLLQGI